MVDVSARPSRGAHRPAGGRPRAGSGARAGRGGPEARRGGPDRRGGPAWTAQPEHPAVPEHPVHADREWLTRPLPAVPAVGRAPDADPPTEQLPAVPGAPDGPAALPATPPAVSRQPLAPQPAAVVSPGPTGRRRALVRVGVVTALLTLVATGATAVAADKVVTVTVDGRDRVVHTFAADVAGALRSAGLAAAPQDRLEPAPTTDLADGDHVILQRARPLTLVEGRSERRIWTTAASVDEALRNVGVEAQPIQMSTAPGTTIPLGGLAVEVRVPRAVKFVDGSAAPEPVTSTAGTVAGLLAERGVTLGPDDVAVPRGDTPITAGMTVQVVRNGVGEVVEVHRIDPPEQLVDDPELPRGQREVVEKGRAGEQTVVMRVLVSNGAEIRREQVRAGATTPPEKRVVRVGTNDDLPDRAAAPAAGPGVWDALARCEAGGNWSTNSGNGYYGGLQFDRQTWVANGGDEYADLPHQADRDAQIAVASKVRDQRGGYGSWPACARKLGLPT